MAKNSTYHYLSDLGIFLKERGLHIDSDKVLGLIAKASPLDTLVIDEKDSETIAVDETAAAKRSPRKRVNLFYSDYILDRNGLVSKEYIGGKEALQRGVGKESKEGDVHKVEYNGREAIAKILKGDSEARVWEKMYELNMPQSIARHVPIIYDIIRDGSHSIIIMEELEPLSLHIKDSLTSDLGRDTDSLTKNDEYVYEALRLSISSLCSSGCSEKVSKELIDNLDYYTNEISGGIFSEALSIEDSHTYLSGIVNSSNSIRYGDLSDEDKESLINLLSSAIRRAFTVSKRPIPKYHDPDRLNRMREHSRGAWRRRIDRDMKGVYTKDPIGFLFSEKHMPETKSLFDALKFFKENGIVWDDVHTGNLMQRPATKDVVLIDVGLYSIK